MVQETYTVEEDPQELAPVVSVETNEDGTTRRTETTVTRIDGKLKFTLKSVQITPLNYEKKNHFVLVCHVTEAGLRFRLYIQKLRNINC